MLLDNHDSIDLPTFLSEYWQKKPLLLKNALPGFIDFLSPEELAGLACEESVESRIVFNTPNKWEVKNGPFARLDPACAISGSLGT
jgi:50S ribosomal protein L16 3-hydroxylase